MLFSVGSSNYIKYLGKHTLYCHGRQYLKFLKARVSLKVLKRLKSMILKEVVSRQIINHSQDKTHLAGNRLAGRKSAEINQGVLTH